MKSLARIRATGALVVGSLAAACLWTPNALAAFIPVGSGTALTFTDSYLANPASTPTSPLYSPDLSGSDYLLGVPGQYTFSHTFSTPQSNVLGTDGTAGDYSFQDSYVFQVGAGASGDTVVATLNLPSSFGMSDLQMRLYDIGTSSTTPVVGGSLAVPGVTVISPWLGSHGPATQQITADFSGLMPGDTYVLDIAGTATGSSGGLYIGALDLQPVPLPASLWLLVSGMGALALASRRRFGKLSLTARQTLS